jgi:uncharacterized protein (UPF0335 family)
LENSSRQQLRSFIERIERVEEEKRALAEDVKEMYARAKSLGFDTKALRKVIADRRKDQDELRDFDAIVDTYKPALTVEAFESSPLGKSIDNLKKSIGDGSLEVTVAGETTTLQ